MSLESRFWQPPRATDLFPLCGEHLIELIEDQADPPRFIHLSDLMGEPQ